MPDEKVQIPSQAVDGDDISVPAEVLLRRLSLLPTKDELIEAGRAKAAFTGPPESVALIEAGATAANKWWSAGLGGAAIAAWAAIRGWWASSEPATQHIALWVGAIVTAAALLGIAYLLGSDVRGRAAVATATVNARASVAEEFIRAAQLTRTGMAGTGRSSNTLSTQSSVIPLHSLVVENIAKSGADEAGWHALALATDGVQARYFVVKGTAHEWVDSDKIKLV